MSQWCSCQPACACKELEERERCLEQTDITISQDVACGLLYLHQWKPFSIIHCDVSSSNVLREPLYNSWWAKVSDYESAMANFMNTVQTAGPVSPAYATSEACFPNQHSKNERFSFGVLLVEMCLWQLLESDRAQREVQIQCIQWPCSYGVPGETMYEREYCWSSQHKLHHGVTG